MPTDVFDPIANGAIPVQKAAFDPTAHGAVKAQEPKFDPIAMGAIPATPKPITISPQEMSSHKAETAARQSEPVKPISKSAKTGILDMPSEPEEGTLSKEPLGSPLTVGTQVLSGGKYVSFGEFMRDNAKQMKEGHGVLNAVVDTGIIAGDLAEGLTNPQTLAILGIMAVAPEAGWPLLLKKGADIYFSADQARAAAKEINEGYQAHLAGDDREAYRKFGSAAVQTVFAVLSGKGAARKPNSVGAIEPKAKTETKAEVKSAEVEPIKSDVQRALSALTEGVDGEVKPEVKPVEGKAESMKAKPAYTGSERRVADKVKDRERIDAMQFGINERRRNLESPDTPEADKESLRDAIKQYTEMLDDLRTQARGAIGDNVGIFANKTRKEMMGELKAQGMTEDEAYAEIKRRTQASGKQVKSKAKKGEFYSTDSAGLAGWYFDGDSWHSINGTESGKFEINEKYIPHEEFNPSEAANLKPMSPTERAEVLAANSLERLQHIGIEPKAEPAPVAPKDEPVHAETDVRERIARAENKILKDFPDVSLADIQDNATKIGYTDEEYADSLESYIQKKRELADEPSKPRETIPGTRDIAQRIVNAENRFRKVLMDRGGITEAEAEKVMRFMLQKKIAKLDPVGGEIKVTHGAYLDRDAVRKAVDESQSPKALEDAFGVEVHENFPLSKGTRESLARAGNNRELSRQFERVGITSIEVEAPHRFGLSEQGNIHRYTGEIRLNSAATDAENTIAHELAHDIFNRLGPEATNTLEHYLDEHPEIESQHAGGLEEKIADHFANVLQGKATVPEDVRKAFFDSPLEDRPVKKVSEELPEHKDAPSADIVLAGDRKSWKSVEDQGGSLRASDDIASLVAEHGEWPIVVKDVNGFRHVMPASMFAELMKTPANGFVREAWMAAKGIPLDTIKLDKESGATEFVKLAEHVQGQLGEKKRVERAISKATPKGLPEAKRAADFKDSGDYDVTINGKIHKIYRDPESGWWYESVPGKHFSETSLGFTKEEALQRLADRAKVEPQSAKGRVLRPEERRLHEMFTPGNIVYSDYWRSYSKVLRFTPESNGEPWSVTEITTDKAGNPIPGEEERTHHTYPDKKDYVVKVVSEALVPKAAEAPVHAETKEGDGSVLPGMEKPVAEQRQAAQEHRDGEVSAEMQQKLSSPLGSVDKAAGEMKSRSPLFRGTDADPQNPMFPSESSDPLDDPNRVVPGARSASTGNETQLSDIDQYSEALNRNPARGTFQMIMDWMARRDVIDPNRGPVQRMKDSLADLPSKAGNTFTNAWDATKVAMSSLWDSYAHLPKWTEFNTITGKWDGALQITAKRLNDFYDAMLKSVPDVRRREAIANWIHAGGDEVTLQRWAKESTKPDIKRGYENALNLTPDERVVANNISQFYDSMFEMAKNNGIETEYLQNYVDHIVQDNPTARKGKKLAAEINFSELKTNPRFTRQRVFETFFEGEKKGYRYAKDIAYLTTVHYTEMSKAIANRAYIKSLLDGVAEDGRPLAMPTRAVTHISKEDAGDPTRFIKPDAQPKNSDGYETVNHPALRKWRWAFTDPSGANIFVEGDIILHPEIAKHVKRTLGKSAVKDYAVGRAILKASQVGKSTMLSFSGFHQTQIGVHALEHMVNPFNVKELDLNDPRQKALVEHGLMVADFHGEQGFSEGVQSVGLAKFIPGVGELAQRYQKYMFRDWIPRVKMTMALDAVERNRGRFAKELKAGKITDDQVLKLSADEANAAFGGMNHRQMGTSKTMNDLLRLVMLSPDFTISRAKFVGQALKPHGGEQRAALLKGALVMYGTARVLNYLINNGDAKWDMKDAFSIVIKGKAYGLRTIQGDILNLIEDPNRFFQYRANPLTLKPVIQFLTHKDPYGRYQSNLDLIGSTAKGVGIPLPFKGLLEQNDRTLLDSALQAMGVQEWRYYTPAEALGTEYKQQNVGGNSTPPEESRRASAKYLVEDLYRQARQGKGEDDDVTLPDGKQRLIDEFVKGGVLTQNDVTQAEKMSHISTLESALRYGRLSLSQLLNMYDKASDPEKEAISERIVKKIDKSTAFELRDQAKRLQKSDFKDEYADAMANAGEE